eukprot:12840866-Alexandrium_andersonii.AAC.1
MRRAASGPRTPRSTRRTFAGSWWRRTSAPGRPGHPFAGKSARGRSCLRPPPSGRAAACRCPRSATAGTTSRGGASSSSGLGAPSSTT